MVLDSSAIISVLLKEPDFAFLRFGKGRHSAALNFGDCMAYAVARVANTPLLCKGRDFESTDLAIAK